MTWRWLAFWRLFRWGPSVEQAQRLFPRQREQLELQFFQAVSASGKPRGLRWKAIDWESAVTFARERASGRLAALIGVTIQFEAIEGSDMEGLPAVGNLRNGSAVFFYHAGRWHTTGKTIFNLNPEETLLHFGNQYERLPSEGGSG